MLLRRSVWAVVFAGMLVWASQVSAGWIIDQVVKGSDSHQQVIVQENWVKVTVMDENGQPKNAVIMDTETQAMTQIDYGNQQYTTASLQEYGQLLQNVRQALLPKMEATVKKMEEQMKSMNPEQRKMMEQFMGSRGVTGGQVSQVCPEPPPTEVRKTEQTDTIAGYSALRYDVLVDQKPRSELWIAKDITISKELDPKQMERFSATVAKLAACNPAIAQGFLGDGMSWKLVNEGYPVRVVRGDSRRTVEVTKAENRSVLWSEFRPPLGFTPKTLQERINPQSMPK